MENKNVNELLNDLKEINNKINDDSTELEESLQLFEKSKEIIKVIEDKLNNYQGIIKKVIGNSGETEDFVE